MKKNVNFLLVNMINGNNITDKLMFVKCIDILHNLR